MKIQKMYEKSRKIITQVALAGAILLNGCEYRPNQTTQESPYFVVKNLEAVLAMDHGERLRDIRNGVTYTPIVRFDTLSPQLEGIKAQQGDEIYIFRSGMYDSRLTEIQNTKGEAYLRVGRLPEKFQSFEGVVGEDVDASFTRFIKELSK